jgi:hypothetical protein
MSFAQCLKEAQKLNTKHFSPELDTIEDETVSSVLYKVLTEHDLLEEGELDVPRRSAEAWKKKVSSFIQKWRHLVEVESERKLYNKF